jgi:hypothetical protein
MHLLKPEQSQVNSLNFKDEDDAIDQLILSGALEVAGIDIETGEPIYNFTEKLIEVSPELHKDISLYFSRETMALWSDGFLNMDVTEKNPIVTITKKSLDEEEVSKLSKESQRTLKEIIRVIFSDK